MVTAVREPESVDFAARWRRSIAGPNGGVADGEGNDETAGAPGPASRTIRWRSSCDEVELMLARLLTMTSGGGGVTARPGLPIRLPLCAVSRSPDLWRWCPSSFGLRKWVVR